MQRIKSTDEVENVLKQIGVGPGQELRESEKRRNSLERFAQMRSRNPNTTLKLEDVATAFVEVEEDDVDEFRNITVTSRKIEQHDTELPDDYWDYLIQKGMTVHEVGHILYSSWPVLENYLRSIRRIEENREGGDPDQTEMLFKHFTNVLEDGAIERFLAEDFRVGEELHALREALHENTYMGREYAVDGGTEYHYPFFFAIMAACLNIGVYDNNELDKLVDENNDKHQFAFRGDAKDKKRFKSKCLPKIRKYIPKIQSETDPRKRMDLCYELWDFLEDYINRSTSPGKTDWEVDVKEGQEGDSYAPNAPANMNEGHGEQEESPVGGEMEEAEDSLGDERQGIGETEDMSEVEEKASQGIQSESKQHGEGDWSDEIENIIDTLEGGEGIDEIAIAEDGQVDRDRQKKAMRHAKRTSETFRRRLRRFQKDKVKKGKRRGTIDPKRMISAEKGSTKIFEKTKPGEDKDYSCAIVVDRSGSMSGVIDELEIAVGSVAWGLEANGVDTCILDTESSQTTLSKPFGTKTENFKEKLFSRRCGGGTPLTSTFEFAKERIDQGAGEIPFCIVMTDGAPASRSNFKDAVGSANFPVLGMYFANNRANVQNQLKLYNKAVTVQNSDDVNKKLIDLINQIMF